MKNLLLALLISFSSTAVLADIQSPPGAKYNRSRKLSRGVSNIMYSLSEIPQTWARTTRSEGPMAGASAGLIDGTKRTIVRLGFGVYEILTFHGPSYKGGYGPVGKKLWWGDLHNGYSEFPPEIGFKSQWDYTRSTRW